MSVQASTLPVVVISSTNQVTSAWASVMWYNTLSTSEPRVPMTHSYSKVSGLEPTVCKVCDFVLQNLSLFLEPPPLSWTQLSQVLSWQFLSVGQRELDENQLEDLKERIVGECLTASSI